MPNIEVAARTAKEAAEARKHQICKTLPYAGPYGERHLIAEALLRLVEHAEKNRGFRLELGELVETVCSYGSLSVSAAAVERAVKAYHEDWLADHDYGGGDFDKIAKNLGTDSETLFKALLLLKI